MNADRRTYVPADRAKEVERELRLTRAVEAYRVFYPSVSSWSFFADNIAMGMEVNRRHTYCQYRTNQNALTPNSDTPYGVLILDATDAPVVVELPTGPLMGAMDDWYFQEAGNMGLPGPDQGRGGRHLVVGPDYTGEIPEGYFVDRPATNHCVVVMRAVPQPGPDGVAQAMALLSQIKTYPLGQPDRTEMVDITGREIVVTSAVREETIDFWKAIHSVINDDVLLDEFALEYGRLAAVGIERGKPFPTDAETHQLLLEATGIALEQLTVESLCSSRPDRFVWPDRAWEWAGLVTDTGFIAPHYVDLYARDRWFYQATFASKKMFPRQAGVGSIYLLGTKDADGEYLRGDKTYRLAIKTPVPAQQFWSLTAYDVRYRSQINADSQKAAFSSSFDHLEPNEDGVIEVFLGPGPAPSDTSRWLETIPGRDWFVFFRLYGPGPEVFTDSWKLGDFTVWDGPIP